MDKKELFSNIIDKIKALSESSHDRGFVLQAVCRLLKNNLPGCDWVGFYLVDDATKRELVLGPYAGEPTEHIRIPFGKGICGQAAEVRQTFIIDDVSKETNYLSCSAKVRSEIVVPIFKAGRLVGELDIDSHTPGAFTDEDDRFLKEICGAVSHLL